MDGVLVIDKPAGPTSHDVVQLVKRAIGARKVGHLGTLDPAATGVLPLCIDGATKKASELSGGEKEYAFTLVLGQTTDTDDAAGQVTAEYPVDDDQLARLPQVVERYTGEVDQVPPQYSARKVGGVRMYKLARKGRPVTAKPRRVTIHELIIEERAGARIRMRMRCGGGTYVRALCRDIGKELGCGGHAADIRRLRSGRFTIDQAVNLPEVPDRWRDALIEL